MCVDSCIASAQVLGWGALALTALVTFIVTWRLSRLGASILALYPRFGRWLLLYLCAFLIFGLITFFLQILWDVTWRALYEHAPVVAAAMTNTYQPLAATVVLVLLSLGIILATPIIVRQLLRERAARRGISGGHGTAQR